ncbi:hypothetical protein CMV_026808 [Castanea mollissima]|uniref:Uncharacterized protein n=1 Tax=Castanea mollissima TaxID=60419 RepID=A0A8J4QJC4_9ROSI|nr:hypothetical protein CMV_026808 [Castanea mollissima]
MEEKAMGVNPDNVPFDDNVEEEEEAGESCSPLTCHARTISGIQGFPHVMIGADGLSYGSDTHDGFPMLDLSRVKRC